MQLAEKWPALLTVILALLSWYGLNAVDLTADAPQNRTVLAVFAHPDDEMTVAPLLSRLAREGDRVYLAVATDGRYGVSEHAGIPAGDSLAAVRTREIHCVAEKLGIEPPIQFGLEDGFAHKSPELGSVMEDLGRLHASVRKIFIELQPDAVITWNPGGGYGHPDHRMVSNIVTEVYQLGGENWPKELLYTGMPTDRFGSIPESSNPTVQWFVDSWHGVSPEYLPVRLSYEQQDLDNARASLGCHESQFTEEAMDGIGKLIGHIYDGKVTLRPWSGDGSIAMELLE